MNEIIKTGCLIVITLSLLYISYNIGKISNYLLDLVRLGGL
ncbi:hypothetical protein DFO70_11785 [Cytobacillus firmus]|uniref:Uncharacterized protein n=2 Tax=Cytobacillus TaxID=2675230 RepID=A0A366JKA2_CYTFI|nr:hypothetical protein DFO70_11785 [Cytobacillus firmus]TDX39257.1 hypothetical protein DFO72_11187 [Cytobacillus oceanisediminis]